MKTAFLSLFLFLTTMCFAQFDNINWKIRFDDSLMPEDARSAPLSQCAFDDARTFAFSERQAELDQINGSRLQVYSHAVAFCTLNVEKDCDYLAGMGADWWFQCYVNGELAKSTLEDDHGNVSYPPSAKDFVFPIRLHEGENHIALYLERGGGDKWLVAFGIQRKLNPTDESDRQYYSIPTLTVAAGAKHRKPYVRRNRNVIAQLADPQIGFKDYDGELSRFRKEIDIINESDCKAVVICGDMMHLTTRESLTVFQKELSRLKRPVFMVAGNHDVGQDSRELFQEFFGPTYYAADLPFDGYRLVVVDTNLWQAPNPEENAKMDAMLLKELEAAKVAGKKVVIAGHCPLFQEDEDEDEAYYNLPMEKREWLKELFGKYPVVAYLAGHSHTAFTVLWHGVLLSNAETTSVAFDKINYGFRRIVLFGDSVYFNTIPVK
ncbi:MAG: metallophosphoesterase [Lentisphaeria bacterium]|nr:metallophosphoesterase [Lentisphaeria bacterium]